PDFRVFRRSRDVQSLEHQVAALHPLVMAAVTVFLKDGMLVGSGPRGSRRFLLRSSPQLGLPYETRHQTANYRRPRRQAHTASLQSRTIAAPNNTIIRVRQKAINTRSGLLPIG